MKYKEHRPPKLPVSRGGRCFLCGFPNDKLRVEYDFFGACRSAVYDLQLTNSVAIPPESPNFKALGQGTFLGVPNLAFLIIFLLIFFWFVVNYTNYGRHLYAIGGNEAAAKASGINVNKTKITAFMLSGTLSGLAGFACASRLNVAQPNIGTAGVAFEFDAVIGCVLGGASLVGGKDRLPYSQISTAAKSPLPKQDKFIYWNCGGGTAAVFQ